MPPSLPSQPPPDAPPHGLRLAKKPWYKRWWAVVLGVVLVLLLGSLAAAWTWYQRQLEPVAASAAAESRQIVIRPGSTPDAIGQQLEAAGLIRHQLAFSIHTRLEGVRGQLQAGAYRLSPADSTPEIVAYLTKGRTDEFTVTFFPGSSLYIDSSDSGQTPSHREVLEKLGYQREEIEAAFTADYDHPLLADKPPGATVEGYVYGETYQMPADATVQDILQRTFDEMYAQLQQHNLPAGFAAHGLSLHQAVTLASIVEREASGAADQKQVAQIFYRRLEIGMPLEADATFVYAARMAGQTPSVDFDSPYNTRRHKGLPPGPIASPGLTALQAVAEPAAGDYLYFVSGDDGKNYYARTLEEHEQNIARHCQRNCALF